MLCKVVFHVSIRAGLCGFQIMLHYSTEKGKFPAVSVLLKNTNISEKVTCGVQIYRGNRVLNKDATCLQTSHFSQLLPHQKEQ